MLTMMMPHTKAVHVVPFNTGRIIKYKPDVATYSKKVASYWGDFWTCSACYIMIQQMEKGYNEVENYIISRVHMQNILCSTRYCIVQKFN